MTKRRTHRNRRRRSQLDGLDAFALAMAAVILPLVGLALALEANL